METLESVADLEALVSGNEGSAVLFKHSTRCPLSASAIEEFRAAASARPDAARYVYLDLSAREYDDPQALAQQVARMVREGASTHEVRCVVGEARYQRAIKRQIAEHLNA